MKREQVKDLGVTITDKLTFGNHINRVTGETYNFLRNVKIAFTYTDEEMIS